MSTNLSLSPNPFRPTQPLVEAALAAREGLEEVAVSNEGLIAKVNPDLALSPEQIKKLPSPVLERYCQEAINPESTYSDQVRRSLEGIKSYSRRSAKVGQSLRFVGLGLLGVVLSALTGDHLEGRLRAVAEISLQASALVTVAAMGKASWEAPINSRYPRAKN